MTRLIFRETVSTGATVAACDFLASRTGLSKSSIKDAMVKGAVRIKRQRGGMKRLRRAKTSLKKGDRIEFYYDEELLSLSPPRAACLDDHIHYTVWYKPAGLLAQGTEFGDHCSLVRQAELFFPLRPVFIVHRLDREAEGLMLLAHNRVAAAKLSLLFRKDEIVKKYRAEVTGRPGEEGYREKIELPLDGKEAITRFEMESFDPQSNTSVLSLTIGTGRFHQIRRHMEMIGHPVVGDPRYGKANKNVDGMRLSAVSLRFLCPFEKREVEFDLPFPYSCKTNDAAP